VAGIGSQIQPLGGLIEIRLLVLGQHAAQMGLTQDPAGYRRIVLGGFLQRLAGLVAFGLIFGGQQDERHPVGGILVTGGGRLAVVLQCLVAGGFHALAGLVGVTEQIERVGIAFLGQRLGQLDGLGVAAFLESLHGFLGRTFDVGRNGRRGVVHG